MRLILATAFLFLTSLGACGAAPPPDRPSDRKALTAIVAERKFVAHDFYTGADTPEDRQPLQDAVDDAGRDILAMPDPLNGADVRARLDRLLALTHDFATEDRDEVGRYAVRIWRAAGFKTDSGLFPVGDRRALEMP